MEIDCLIQLFNTCTTPTTILIRMPLIHKVMKYCISMSQHEFRGLIKVV